MRRWNAAGAAGAAATAVLLAAGPLAAQSEREAVLAVAQALFDAMETRDTAAYNRIVLPEVRYLAVLDLGGPATVQWTASAELLTTLSTTGPTFREKMWDAEVRISGPLAAIWTPYDFHFGEQLSHCGVDAFHLVKVEGAWRIAQISYTVVRPQSRCAPGPVYDEGSRE